MKLLVDTHDDDLVYDIEDWFLSRGVTVWGRGFDIVSEDGRYAACQWFAHQLQQLAEWQWAQQSVVD